MGTFIAGILAVIFGGNTFATAGNTAEISGGKTWNICVDAGASYAGSDFVVNIAKTDFASQIVLGNGDCKAVEMAAGTYTVSLNGTMGAGAASYEIANDTVTFSVANSLRKYLNTFGSIAYTVEGSGEESQFELLFSMPGECQFNGNANVSGETCKDGDGNPLTNKKYIDTNVALFSEENAGRDFEVYFTLTDYATTQAQQGTLFNAKYENSSMYYPGFVIRTVGTNGETMEITGRLGKDNTNADKANNSIVTADIKNKEVKIVRVGGMVSYSIDGGEMIPFQDYKNFSRYFNQTAVFGASMQTNGNPQRYYDGTIKNIRVYLKKDTTAKIVFDANGGTGTMAAIEDIEVGTDVVLPANTFAKEGAAFDGWNTEADGTGVPYVDGATIAVTTAGDITLYAQWARVATATLKAGQAVNTAIKGLASNGSGVWYDSNNENIKYLEFVDTLPDTVNDSTPKVNIALDGEIPVYAYWLAGDKTIYINSEAERVYANQDSSYMFNKMKALTSLTLPSSLDTSNVVNMSHMFDYTSYLASLTLSEGFNTSSVTDMSYMFGNMSYLTSLTFSDGFDTSNVTDMHEMFAFMPVLTSLTLSERFNTANVTDMNYMFTNARALTSLTFSDSFDTSNVTDMNHMFSGVSALTSLTLPDSFNTENVTNMAAMFSEMYALTSLTLPDSFNTENVTNMSDMFGYMKALTSLTLPESFDTSNVTSMSFMFREMKALTSLTLPDSFNTENVTNMNYMFFSMSALTSLTLPDSFNTSNVTNMSAMFDGAKALTSLTLPAAFNTEKVTNMLAMFRGMTALTSLTLPDSFVIYTDAATSYMFGRIKNTATLYAFDATARSLWPGVLGN